LKSYLKWAGGKSRLNQYLIPYFPKSINNYIEPFIGSASVFLDFIELLETSQNIFDNEIIFPNKFFLNDLNSTLINSHICVSNYIEELLVLLNKLQKEYDLSENKELLFKEKRKDLNDIINIKFDSDKDNIKKASLFIFINKTCFNGLWRVNGSGFFNVPWNKVQSTNIYNEKEIRECSKLFKKAEFSSKDFQNFIELNLEENDFVFLDPPYIPLSISSSFTSYTSDNWGIKENERLLLCLKYIDFRKAKFMLTNNFSDDIVKIFKEWNIRFMDAHRFIKPVKNINDEKRNKVKEIIVTNY